MNRVGFSKDIHRLEKGRKFILGGVEIPFEKGEVAHSDGDVLYHAVSESILGALALGDLGKHFPDNDDKTKDMDSSLIMKRVFELMDGKGFKIGNIDTFISCEKPKLSSYIEMMRFNIANLLCTSMDNISVKAGTNEGCGEVGKGEAVEVYCISNLISK